MSAKQRSNWSILNGLRNMDIEQFYIIKENGIHKNIHGIVNAEADPFPLKLYKLNLMNGKPDPVSLNLDLPNINPNLLAEEIRRYWYFWVYMTSTDIIRLFENTTIEEIPEDHEVAYNVLKRRVDDLSKICSTARFSPVVGKAAKNIAKLLYGAPLSDFDQSIQVATREVINELQGLCMKTQLQTNPRVNECNVDELRRKIVKLYVSFWGSKDEEPGFVKRIRHRCRHDMAVGLLTHYYHRNFGTCSIVARNTIYSKRNILSNNDLFRETIFRYIELLQQIQRKKDTSEKKEMLPVGSINFEINKDIMVKTVQSQQDSSGTNHKAVSEMNYENEIYNIDQYLLTDRECVNYMICPKCSSLLAKKRYNVPAFDIKQTFISYYVEELLFCPNCSIAFITEENYISIQNRISADKLYISPSNIQKTNKRKNKKYLYEPIAGFEFCYEKSLKQSNGVSPTINTLSDSSFLANDGYRTNLSDDQRHQILQSAAKRYGKRRVADHLRFLITTREGQNKGMIKYENALRVWHADLNYLVEIEHQSTISDDEQKDNIIG